MGFKLIQKMGWSSGSGLGKFEQGDYIRIKCCCEGGFVQQDVQTLSPLN